MSPVRQLNTSRGILRMTGRLCRLIVPLAMMGILLNIMTITGHSQKAGGPLPRGEMKVLGPTAAPAPVAPSSESQWVDCFTYLGTPLIGDQFLSDSGELFVLADEALGKGVSTAAGVRKRTVTRMRLASGRLQPLFSVTTAQPGAIVPHGAAPFGFTVATFAGAETGCYQGAATAVSISLMGKAGTGQEAPEAAKSVEDAKLGIVPATVGRVLADLTQGRILEIDPKSLQRRGLFDFGRDVVPLYFDVAGRKLFAVRNDKEGWLLEHLMLGRATPLQSLRLAGGEKILRQEGNFGVLVLDRSKRSFRIRELAAWSGVKQDRNYSVALPEGMDVSKLAVIPHFPTKHALIMGNTLAQRRQQQKALLVNYQRGKVVAEFIPQKGTYFRSLDFNPDGREVMLVVMDEATQKHREVRIYHIKRKSVRTLKL